MATTLLSVKKVAAILEVHPGTIKRWVMAGVLTPTATEGARVFFLPDDITAIRSRLKNKRTRFQSLIQ